MAFSISHSRPLCLSFDGLELQHWDALTITDDNIQKVNGLLSSAQIMLTFWGSRIVVINGKEKVASLDGLVAKLLIEAKERVFNSVDRDVNYPGNTEPGVPISDSIRDSWLSIEDRLQYFYKTVDVQVKNSSCFTQFFICLRQFIDRLQIFFFLNVFDFCSFHPERCPQISRSLIEQRGISKMFVCD